MFVEKHSWFSVVNSLLFHNHKLWKYAILAQTIPHFTLFTGTIESFCLYFKHVSFSVSHVCLTKNSLSKMLSLQEGRIFMSDSTSSIIFYTQYCFQQTVVCFKFHFIYFKIGIVYNSSFKIIYPPGSSVCTHSGTNKF